MNDEAEVLQKMTPKDGRNLTEQDMGELATSVVRFQAMVKNCPMPTQGELKKLLALQGTVLNSIGLGLLMEVGSVKSQSKKYRLALQTLECSRNALKAAAAIECSDEKD